jgi:hypothetical protein
LASFPIKIIETVFTQANHNLMLKRILYTVFFFHTNLLLYANDKNIFEELMQKSKNDFHFHQAFHTFLVKTPIMQF